MASQSEVIRAIWFEYSLCVWGLHLKHALVLGALLQRYRLGLLRRQRQLDPPNQGGVVYVVLGAAQLSDRMLAGRTDCMARAATEQQHRLEHCRA